MGLKKPYKRTVRQFADGSYSNSGNSRYLKHPDYAISPEKHIRSFLLIQNDLQKLFEYVEPADKNKLSYSYRIHELFVRVCIEVEANCKAILLENGYVKKNDLNMSDYRLIEQTHKLSEYEITLPRWDGKYGRYKPFSRWAEDKGLQWYQYYNGVKHDIHSNFKHANIKNLVEATCGLVALLSAQFLDEDFSPNVGYLALQGSGDGMESSIDGYFRVKYPNWAAEDRYDFNWQEIKDKPNIIQCHNYNSIE
ncbi:MAG: hypothetical protein ACD_32C00152G0001 [uncultured bacterium]|uniref:Uncharacterized protein n=1 Tax=Candidatus Curtissbacteria bacterium GW2011_GWC2_38_9 TaxID=1618414 RepID=A0A0G0PKS8_9BACT|nr:MAG: hypothetical protein ACD_32C00152G0001 [uncultured bacterium]KKQ89911.1 MAG: hypothetical protein UT12_C0006G0019 [Candidatus Curtissbacteria bacterium GW2011_GWC2_38_9]OGE22442.1 MAG: hypothetical protein A2778_00080 [Candidatus Daviesbacteria bacterium RIFCSPHIGHO2_01_FULL_40_24]OGE43210.1 MAG: hypothetical protein A3A53_05890 [Candidatus Daviesbacteria bacterium RIFCSPLOWO2_01_FULL_39_23]OGE66088.1 MAG: hypothetical protein A3J16_00085 [Candidatus Daviesbacteria bacterium RIFCSPLOWO2